MKIATITPTRGDRPHFLHHCLRQIDVQTRQPDYVEVVQYPPESGQFDLVARIRKGIERAADKGCEWVFIIEDDDFYPPQYIDFVMRNRAENTIAFGWAETYYYHIRRREYLFLPHPMRASLFTTSFHISALEGFRWPRNNEMFLDIHLWEHFVGRFRNRVKLIQNVKGPIGIKHGVGKTGGKGHNSMRYHWSDDNFEWLKKHTTPSAFNFYKNYFSEANV